MKHLTPIRSETTKLVRLQTVETPMTCRMCGISSGSSLFSSTKSIIKGSISCAAPDTSNEWVQKISPQTSQIRKLIFLSYNGVGWVVTVLHLNHNLWSLNIYSGPFCFHCIYLAWWKFHLGDISFKSSYSVEPWHEISSLCIRTDWSEPLLVARLFYEYSATDWPSFGVFKFKRRLHKLVWVSTCQNATLSEITCHGSIYNINVQLS